MRVNGSAGDNSIQSCRGIPAHHPLFFSSAFPSGFALTLSPGRLPRYAALAPWRAALAPTSLAALSTGGRLTRNQRPPYPERLDPAPHSGPIREYFARKHVRNGSPELIRERFARKDVRNCSPEGIRTDSVGKHVRNGPLELIRACFAAKPVRNGSSKQIWERFAGKPVKNGSPKQYKAGMQCSPAGPFSIISGHGGEHCMSARSEIRERFAGKHVRNGGMLVLFTENKAIAGKWHLRL